MKVKRQSSWFLMILALGIALLSACGAGAPSPSEDAGGVPGAEDMAVKTDIVEEALSDAPAGALLAIIQDPGEAVVSQYEPWELNAADPYLTPLLITPIADHTEITIEKVIYLPQDDSFVSTGETIYEDTALMAGEALLYNAYMSEGIPTVRIAAAAGGQHADYIVAYDGQYDAQVIYVSAASETSAPGDEAPPPE